MRTSLTLALSVIFGLLSVGLADNQELIVDPGHAEVRNALASDLDALGALCQGLVPQEHLKSASCLKLPLSADASRRAIDNALIRYVNVVAEEAPWTALDSSSLFLMRSYIALSFNHLYDISILVIQDGYATSLVAVLERQKTPIGETEPED